MTQTVVCMKWGTRYGPDYVNRLYSMVQRHTSRPTRVVCYTDDATGINPAVETYPLPHIVLPEAKQWRPWRKISLWQKNLPGASGKVLYFDLDIVITGNIDDFFDYGSSGYVVSRNWTQPNDVVGNTSIFVFEVGKHSYIYDKMMRGAQEIIDTYDNEQIYISREISEIEFFPDEWCQSFKHSLMPRWPLNFVMTPPLPEGTKVVAFTGKPDPDEAMVGVWPTKRWYQKLYKRVRPTPWIAEHWR